MLGGQLGEGRLAVALIDPMVTLGTFFPRASRMAARFGKLAMSRSMGLVMFHW